MPVNYQINGDWHFTHYNNILFNIGLHNSPLKVKINLNIKQLNFTISNFFTISIYRYTFKYVHQLMNLAFLPAGEYTPLRNEE